MSKESSYFSDDGKRIEKWIPVPDSFPLEQTTEEIQEILNRAKVGDVAHIFPRGEKQAYYVEHGLYQAHGVVEEEQYRPKDGITLWGTWFTMNVQAFESNDARTFRKNDIDVIQIEPAEEYIPQATNGRFEYLGRARVTAKNDQQEHIVHVESYHNGIMSGRTSGGERIIGGASFFHPYRPQKKK